MLYMIEATGGPLPSTPDAAIALLEGMVIPHFEYWMKLEREKKILAGGLPVGDRAFVGIVEAASNDEADRLIRGMPGWPLFAWKVTPLQSVAARADMEQQNVEALKAMSR